MLSKKVLKIQVLRFTAYFRMYRAVYTSTYARHREVFEVARLSLSMVGIVCAFSFKWHRPLNYFLESLSPYSRLQYLQQKSRQNLALFTLKTQDRKHFWSLKAQGFQVDYLE